MPLQILSKNSCQGYIYLTKASGSNKNIRQLQQYQIDINQIFIS
jgi:hypothetical protein